MEMDINLLIASGAAAVGGIAIGLVISILLGHKAREALRAAMTADQDELKSQLGEVQSSLQGKTVELQLAGEQLREKSALTASLQQELAGLSRQFNELKNEHTRLHTEHRERQGQHAEQVQLLNETRENLKKEFENLANKIFEDKGKSFTTTSQASLEAMLSGQSDESTTFSPR